MSGYRRSDQLRRLHDDGVCPDDACPHCARIEQAQDIGTDDRDYLIRNYPEGFREP